MATMVSTKKISILIPCYNEEKGIAKVLGNLPKQKLDKLGFITNAIVIDNNSTDRTAKIATELGATLINEPKQGKGNAVMKGFYSIPKDTDIVVMIDGDNSYKTDEILRMIEPIDSGFCDVVIGTRLNGKISRGSMKYMNRVGNWLLTFLVRVAFHGNVTDVCTGYFAWKKDVIDNLAPNIKSGGFSLEMEMIAKMAKMGYEIYSVPITYDQRAGKSSLHPIKDGTKILGTWFRCIIETPKKRSRRKC